MDTTCPHCQVPLVMDCPACNTLMDVEWQQCKECGYELGNYKLGSIYFTLLAEAYQSRQRSQKALEALHVAEKLNANQPDLYRQMGEVLTSLGRPGDAITTLEKAVKKEPEQVGPYLALGRVLQQEGHWERAEKVYRSAMKVAPKSSETYFALGDLHVQRNRLRNAQKQLQKATRIDPQHGEAWARLGQVYESRRKRRQAIHAYRKANRLLPHGSFDAQQARERLKVLNPRLPARLARSWGELLRQMAGPVLIVILAALLDSGLRPWWSPWTGWLAIVLGSLGAFLAISGYSLPVNPLICLLMGHRGLEGMSGRGFITALGALFWLAAIAVILLPIGQSFPEPPL
jgi:tetratricopeptide (TPR) repeat protein